MSGEYVGWKPLVHEGHRTGYAWHPYLVTHDFDPSRCAGAGIQLQIGFATEAECQAFIDAHLQTLITAIPPPSEEEIDAATDAVMRDYALFRDPRYGTELVRGEVVEILTVALVASRAVLGRPPEETT